MKIIGEISLRIKQNLVALPRQTIEDIKEVYSHPMAILQCQDFFESYPDIKLIDSIDTALSAKRIHDEQLKGIGAIASELAAEKYRLNILKESIETNKMNYTRFLILAPKNMEVDESKIDKASIHFSLAHKIGNLAKITSILSFYEMDMTKIQSMPIMNTEWEYQFYVDLTFKDHKLYKQSLEAIKPFTSHLSVLGEYQKGRMVKE
jgi:prephenate dehydratase